jgi:hypothetical protein
MKYYAGIGSRETPQDVLELMINLAGMLESQGYILRSGGAPGADTAFSNGCSNKEIYLPWRGFNNQPGIVCSEDLHLGRIAAQFHPVWNNLKPAAKKFHTRNVAQILGPDLVHISKFVICYTPNGSGNGGTGQAIRIARHFEVPVYDLGIPDMYDRAQKRVQEWSKV